MLTRRSTQPCHEAARRRALQRHRRRTLIATEVLAAPLGELRKAHTTAGGDALSTTPICIPLPVGTRSVFIEGRNYDTAVVAQIAVNPYLAVIKTADDLATSTDYSENAQDGSASTDVTLSSLGTAAQGDYLYVGSHIPFRGVKIDVDGPNGNASILTVKYWKDDTTDAWTDISATDGTDDSGASIGVDGTVTWTVPTDWKLASLVDIASPAPGSAVQYRTMPLYWTRWEFSAALDSATTLNSLFSLNRSTSYFELTTGRVIEERIQRGIGYAGCIEARVDAGTGALLANVAAGGIFS